ALAGLPSLAPRRSPVAAIAGASAVRAPGRERLAVVVTWLDRADRDLLQVGIVLGRLPSSSTAPRQRPEQTPSWRWSWPYSLGQRFSLGCGGYRASDPREGASPAVRHD